MSDGRSIQFGTIALLTGVAAFFAVRTWGYGERLETRAAAEITQTDLTSASISPQGQFIGVRRKGQKLTIWSWRLDNGKVEHERTLELASQDGEAAESVPFAISPDVARIAWPAAGSVRVEEIFAANPARGAIRLERNRPLAGLAFTDSKRLAMLYRDGQLELRDLESRKTLASQKTAVDKPGPLLGYDSKLAVFSLSTGDVYTFDTASGRISSVEYKRVTPPLMKVALSGSGRIAALTDRGVIHNDALCAAPGSVKALAFDNAGRILAVGDFEGIQNLSPNESPVRVAAAPAGTSVIAVGGEHIALAGPAGATVLTAQPVSALNTVGIAVPSVWALLVLGGLLRLVAGRRAAHEKEVSDQEPVVPAAEAPRDPFPVPPDSLITACRSGECVLFAGAGLAAQAGLPSWEKLVQRLVYWAADQELITRETRAACLVDIEKGNPNIAADKLAAAFIGRERTLHKYLRTVFLSDHALSDSHDLLKELGFAGAITTNFDGLIERTFPLSVGGSYTASDADALQTVDPSREFFLLRLCGSLDRPDTIVFSPAQFAAAMARNTVCSDFLARTLASRSVLFVGASLEGIEDSLRSVAVEQTPTRKHYALVDVRGLQWRGRGALLERRYGIKVIPFLPSDTNYPELPKFLASLRDRMGTQVGPKLDRPSLRESISGSRSVAPSIPAETAPASRPKMRLCSTCGVCYDPDVTVCPLDQTPTDTRLQLERSIEDRYRLERLLGRGGMGAVFEATDLRLNRLVAIKVVISDVFRHANALQRFDREAKAAAKLNHPNIISIYDYGVIGSRGAYLVMERLDGVTWRDQLERLKRVAPSTLATWADQLIEGIVAAHGAGILHRDLKPENVFLAAALKGAVQVKILDFGLAKVKVLSLAGEERLTQADDALGTLGYMPPEQLAGGKADESSDLYAIGVMIIEALTGLDPAEIYSNKDSLQTKLKDLFGVMASSGDIGVLSEVLRRSVATAPRARYRTAVELQQDVVPVLSRIPLARGKEAGS